MMKKLKDELLELAEKSKEFLYKEIEKDFKERLIPFLKDKAGYGCHFVYIKYKDFATLFGPEKMDSHYCYDIIVELLAKENISVQDEPEMECFLINWSRA